MASKWIQDDESGASLLGNAANQPVDHISVENLSQDPSPDDETNRHFQQRRSRWRAYLPFTGSDARRRRHGEVLDFTDGKTKVNRRRGLCRSCMNITLGMLVVLGALNIVGFFVSLSRLLWDNDLDRILSDWGRPGHEGEDLANWPTDFSRDIIPIPCHSHNDYWRRVPLYDAISAGCISVEADIWLFDNELFVGHDTSSLTRNRTLRNLYLNPIIDILEKQNPSTNFTNPDNTVNGIFDTDPSQQLTLLIDFKMDGPTTWPFLIDQLKPLLQRGYLTTFNGTAIVPGPVTIVGTGNTPFSLVTANSTRHIFFDAPLDQMWEEEHSDSDDSPSSESSSENTHSTYQQRHRPGPRSPPPTHKSSNNTYTPQNSYYASVSFGKAIGRMWRNALSPSQLALIRGHVLGAHHRGLKVRYWDLPNWPIGFRDNVWDILVKEGVDILNVDDLKGASQRDWGKRKGWF